MNMPICRCSECDPEGAEQLLAQLASTCASDFDSLIEAPTIDPKLFESSFKRTQIQSSVDIITSKLPICSRNDKIRSEETFNVLCSSLTDAFDTLFKITYPEGSELKANNLLTQEKVWNIIKNYTCVLEGNNLRKVLGSEPIVGTFEMIAKCIQGWRSSQSFQDYTDKIEDRMIIDDQEILNAAIFEEERQEAITFKQLEKARIKSEQDERKRVRLENQAAKRKKEADKKEEKRRKAEDDALVLAGFKLARAQEASHVCLSSFLLNFRSN